MPDDIALWLICTLMPNPPNSSIGGTPNVCRKESMLAKIIGTKRTQTSSPSTGRGKYCMVLARKCREDSFISSDGI